MSSSVKNCNIFDVCSLSSRLKSKKKRVNVGQRGAKIIVIFKIINETKMLQGDREVPVHLTLVGLSPALKFRVFANKMEQM
jgi:hypothetical protein